MLILLLCLVLAFLLKGDVSLRHIIFVYHKGCLGETEQFMGDFAHMPRGKGRGGICLYTFQKSQNFIQ